MSGPLKNPRHERLAQEKAKGTPRHEVFEAEGLSPLSGSSVRLWNSVKVNERVAELRAKATIAHNALVTNAVEVSEDSVAVTIAGLIEEADHIKRDAMAAMQYGAAVSALALKSRLAGFLHDKGEQPRGDTFNIAFIKAPPQETFEQFNERRTRQLRVVGTSARSTNGSGRSNMVS